MFTILMTITHVKIMTITIIITDENHNEDIYNSDKFMITMLVRFKSPVKLSSKYRKVNETTNLKRHARY